ncbi:MAG: amidohydrolase [Armatimonadetes bacterium]|nr:amidohydrolase [Armatimonadota bacterium]
MQMAYAVTNAELFHGAAADPAASALAVSGGRIACVGSTADAVAVAGPGARVVDLQGRFLCPGFVDCHVHLSWLAMTLSGRTVDCDGTRTLQETLQRVREALPRAVVGGWLRGRGWDKNQWPGDLFPTARDLDTVTGDVPAALASHDGHSVWANSAALRAARVTQETPDPPGGRIIRDATGQPTGVLQEAAAALIWDAMPNPLREEISAALREALPQLSALGLTGLHNCEAGDGRSAILQLRDGGALPLRIAHYHPADQFEEVVELTRSGGGEDQWVRLGGLKVFVDGALGGQTAAMLEPYEGSEQAGLLTMDPEEFANLAWRATEAGLALAVHAIGDRAVRMVLDGFRQVRSAWSGPWPRHRIEHAQHVHPADQPCFGQLEIIASVQPAHMLADIVTCERHLGARSRWAFPLRSLLQGGARLAFGSDAPVETVDPLVGLRSAVQRRRHDGTPAEGWYPEQKLTVAEALRGYTLDAAYASGEEAARGSLEPGKLADFVVLSRNPLTTPPDELQDVRVEATVVGGRPTYDPQGLFGAP